MLQKKVISIVKNASQISKEAVISEFMKLANELECNVTEEQLSAYLDEILSERELSDNELDSVAGGKSSDFWLALMSGVDPGDDIKCKDTLGN